MFLVAEHVTTRFIFLYIIIKEDKACGFIFYYFLMHVSAYEHEGVSCLLVQWEMAATYDSLMTTVLLHQRQ
jgi:hypothetical protein